MKECHGEGERIDPKLRCKKCNGRKVNRERKILEVQVDKGMADGQKITFTSEGDQEPGLEPGDIIIVLDEKAHDRFKRSGQDLIMKMDITLTKIDETWAKIEFSFTKHKETDVQLAKLLEEDVETMEDAQVAVQGMMANRYMKTLMPPLQASEPVLEDADAVIAS